LTYLADDIESREHPWNALYQVEAPEAAPLPAGYSDISDFNRLLLLRCLRPDRLTVGITQYIVKQMGEKYVSPPVLDYHALFKQSTCATPVVFVLSPGADPAFDVFR
jgi:dynein heavy chain